MQQTETYKLNLIETSDPFSPDALNRNTQKIEDAMTAHEEAVKAVIGTLDQRVQVFEAKKLVYGTYEGGVETVEVGFAPLAVFIHERATQSHASTYLAVSKNDGYVRFTEDGFQPNQLNSASSSYNYIAFG